MIFEVRHAGRIKALEEIERPEFRAAVDPIRCYIENFLGSDPDFEALRFVFSVDL